MRRETGSRQPLPKASGALLAEADAAPGRRWKS